jgi:hypothetical protein
LKNFPVDPQFHSRLRDTCDTPEFKRRPIAMNR